VPFGQPAGQGSHCLRSLGCRRRVQAIATGSLFIDRCARPEGGRQSGGVDAGVGREADRAVGRPRGQLGRSSFGQQPAVIDDDHPVGHPFGLVELVGCQQHAQALVALGADEVAHHDAALGIDAGRRFVQEQDLRSTDQGQG
jgi:hypothetical protein